jgi:hypothetical protein
MIRQKTYKGFLYFDGLNTFVLSYGQRYVEDGVKRCDLLGIHECTVKNFDLDFGDIDLTLPWDIGTNLLGDNFFFKYLKTILPIHPTISKDTIDKLYCDFLGCIFSQRLGVSASLIERLDSMIKLSRHEDKIIYNPVLISASYFTAYSQVVSFFDK